MGHLPDTNFFIHLIHRHGPLRSRYLAVAGFTTFFLSSIVLYELQVGVEKSSRLEANRERLLNLIANDFILLPFSEEDASAAAKIRATLERQKQPIGPYDTLIAGQAIARGLTLVTANVSEFARVESLQLEDWS